MLVYKIYLKLEQLDRIFMLVVHGKGVRGPTLVNGKGVWGATQCIGRVLRDHI